MPYFVSAVVVCGLVINFTEAEASYQACGGNYRNRSGESFDREQFFLVDLCPAKHVAGVLVMALLFILQP